MLVPSEQAGALKLAFEMYAEPSTSLRDILTYFKEHEAEVGYLRTDEYGGKNGSHNGKLKIGSLSSILKNPLYVRADKSVYAYFQTRGYYSRMRAVRTALMTESQQAIVPLSIAADATKLEINPIIMPNTPVQKQDKVIIRKEGIEIELPQDAPEQTFLALLRGLKQC